MTKFIDLDRDTHEETYRITIKISPDDYGIIKENILNYGDILKEERKVTE